MDKVAIDKARAVFYGFFSTIFAFDFTEEKFLQMVEYLKILEHYPLDEQSEMALKNMARRVNSRGFEPLKSESDTLFFNPLGGKVPMTASFILEQRDDGNKRVEMIDLVQSSPFRRDEKVFMEHEDHIEFICGFLQRIILLESEGDQGEAKLSQKVFVSILNPMVDEFCSRVLEHNESAFYRQAALALESFVEFERLYLGVEKPEEVGAREEYSLAGKDAPKRTRAGCLQQ